MMENQKDSESIDRFLRKELSEEELAAFNRRIVRDDAFAREVAERLSVKKAMKDIRREEIAQIARQTAPDAKPVWSNPLIYVAAVLSIGIVLFFIFQPLRKPQLDEEERKQIIAEWKQQEALVLNTAGGSPADWPGLIARDSLDKALSVLDSVRNGFAAPCSEPYLDYFAGMLYLYHRQDYRKAENILACALGKTTRDGYRADVPKHLAIAKALRGKAREAQALLARYNVSPGALPQSIREYLSL